MSDLVKYTPVLTAFKNVASRGWYSTYRYSARKPIVGDLIQRCDPKRSHPSADDIVLSFREDILPDSVFKYLDS